MAELIDNKSDSEAYKNFINSLDSPVSREGYSQVFPYFMKFCQVTSYEDMLLIDITKLEGLIRDYIIYLKQVRKLAPATISCYVAAIAHFYQMNDVIINWKKLNNFKDNFSFTPSQKEIYPLSSQKLYEIEQNLSFIL